MSNIKSMTGFGSAEMSNENLKINVEIRSLNGKFLECQIRTPKIFRDKETEIRLWASSNIFRGSVQINVTSELKNNEILASGFSINEDLAIIYGKKLSKISASLQLDNSQILAQLLQLPEVTTNTGSILQEEDAQLLFDTLDNAFAKFDSFRMQEGEKTAILLKAYLQEIRENRTLILNMEDDRKAQLRSKVSKSLEEIKERVALDINRFEQELIYYFEKLDIAEELSRLDNHLDYFETTLTKEPGGKKLGFIAQEIGREINTLGSKANHFGMQQAVVEMKESLEKMKEQVLNLL
jgi:uncharacterized protein (TIGR00255 family)